MLKEYQTKANIGIGVGLILNVACRIGGATALDGATGTPRLILAGALLLGTLAGTALFVWGCFMYMIGKGQSGWYGLFGLLSIIGLIVLVCFPDKYKNGQRPPEQRGFPVGPPRPMPPRQ